MTVSFQEQLTQSFKDVVSEQSVSGGSDHWKRVYEYGMRVLSHKMGPGAGTIQNQAENLVAIAERDVTARQQYPRAFQRNGGFVQC